jgi:chromosomal replication initiation ATPase DnaA
MSQYAMSLNLPAVFTAGNFIVSSCNEAAWKWVEAWPDWPQHALLLRGPQGSGKSHLGHIWAERSGATVITAASLSREQPVQGHCLLEDIETTPDERALLHLFNYSRENRHGLLMTCMPPIPSLPFTLPDLTSRLLSAQAAEIEQPDDAVLGGAMRKQFIDRQMAVDDEVIAYILPRIERSLASVRQMVERVDAAALAEHRNVTIPFVKKLL